jgi:hypothetical protein
MYENNDIEWCDYTNKIHGSYDIDYMNETRSLGGVYVFEIFQLQC